MLPEPEVDLVRLRGFCGCGMNVVSHEIFSDGGCEKMPQQ